MMDDDPCRQEMKKKEEAKAKRRHDAAAAVCNLHQTPPHCLLSNIPPPDNATAQQFHRSCASLLGR